MASFLARRLGVMLLTMLCLTLIVFYLVNLEPNLRKLAISQTEMHAIRPGTRKLAGEERLPPAVPRSLRRHGSGFGRKQPNIDPGDGRAQLRVFLLRRTDDAGIFRRARGRLRLLDQVQGQGRQEAGAGAARRPAILMFWVMAVMIPVALVVGVVSGMREGSRTDRDAVGRRRSRRPRRPNMCPAWC